MNTWLGYLSDQTLEDSGASMLAIPAVTSNIETDSEKWGYAFVGTAIDGLLRNLEGEAAIEAYPDFRERRERANELLLELVGQQPQLFYVRRMEFGIEPI